VVAYKKTEEKIYLLVKNVEENSQRIFLPVIYKLKYLLRG